MRKLLAIGVASALALAALARDGAARAAEIRIGFANGSSADYAPAFAAERLGFFKQAGLDVKLIAFRGGAAAQEAMSAGSADLIAYFGPAIALAVNKGAKEKMVATIAAGSVGWNLIVPADSPIKDLKGLDGKKIGISTKASTSDMAALWVAEKTGITVQQIPLGAGALIPALRSHQVDAIVFSALLTMREMLSGRARSLIELGQGMDPTMADVYVASQEMIDKRPQELRAVLTVIYKTLAYMKANRQWSLAFLKDFAKADDDALAAALYDQIIPKLSADGAIEQVWIDNGLNLAARAWEMPELAKVDARTLFTNDFHPTAP